MRKAFIFDFDDTLAVTDCKVIVRQHGSCPENCHEVCKLTPKQFNNYELESDEFFDFSEFRDSNYIQNADPTFLIHLAYEVYNEGHRVYILTARDVTVFDAIDIWMQSHGIKTTSVVCVGGTCRQIAERKKKILLDIVSQYDKIYFYDDSEENVSIFTHEKLRAYLV